MACNISSEEINSSNAEDKSSSQIDTRKKNAAIWIAMIMDMQLQRTRMDC